MNADPIPNRLDGTPSDAHTSATCRHCRHFHCGTRTCAAFPEGIPDAIWWAAGGHREPYPGDHGIQFAERPRVDHPAAYYDIPEFLRRKTPQP